MPDHGIEGTASCNRVGGRELTWTASTRSSGTIVRDRSQPTVTTQVGCNDAAATQIADRFWTLMTKAREWSIARGDLSIHFDDGTIAVFKAVRRTAGARTDCANDPNNLDCRGGLDPRELER